MLTCKECHISFESDKSLHGHLRKHKLKVKGYYEKHYPKTCLSSGKKLQWKDGDDLPSYLSRNFLDKIALNQYFKDPKDAEAKKALLVSYLKEAHERHDILPSQVELASLPISPTYLIYNQYLDLKEIRKANNFKTRYNYDLDYTKPLEIQKVNPEDFTILVDTREQTPYRFYSSVRGKLSEGDYALAGNLFNNVMVERKSVADFGGTVVSGNERFRRELDRVREAGNYLIVLVEFNVHDLYKHKFYGYSNPAFVAHNMRGLIRDYSDCCQFVFGVDRDSCIRYVAEFLLYGPKAREVDLQLYVDYRKSLFRMDEFSPEDLQNLYACR